MYFRWLQSSQIVFTWDKWLHRCQFSVGMWKIMTVTLYFCFSNLISFKTLHFVCVGQVLHFDELPYCKNVRKLLENGVGTKCFDDSCHFRTEWCQGGTLIASYRKRHLRRLILVALYFIQGSSYEREWSWPPSPLKHNM